MTFGSWHGFWPNQKNTIVAPLLHSSKEISIVIPVKNNQEGINQFLNIFNKTHTAQNSPLEIIVVDNCSSPPIKLPNIPNPCYIKLLKCKKLGPASARNVGWKDARGEWILFTDSDCTPSETWISGYISISNGSIGYAGNVLPLSQDPISKYYETQGTLIPSRYYRNDVAYPDYLITANCLIWKKALELLDGFNESIQIAAGEDIDIGFRLRMIGNLSFAWDSLVYHDFGDGLGGFIKRFYRYGKGNGKLSQIFSLNMRPRGIKPQKKTLFNSILAKIQYLSLLGGYYSRD